MTDGIEVKIKMSQAQTGKLYMSHEDLRNKNTKAIELAVELGGIDGAHHKDWVIDQMVRILAGDKYEKIVADACAGEDGPDSYEWDCGIAP